MLEDRPYRVLDEKGRFIIKDENDREVLACRDKTSAEHYVVLLTNAYRKGYRRGYQARKRSQ